MLLAVCLPDKHQNTTGKPLPGPICGPFVYQGQLAVSTPPHPCAQQQPQQTVDCAPPPTIQEHPKATYTRLSEVLYTDSITLILAPIWHVLSCIFLFLLLNPQHTHSRHTTTPCSCH